ncbi:lysylphosphatidylglycerol synthase domain-containing protein [Aromatoleum evansii]|uniref:Lysylphosphatidylglycerol synthase domain-containing protein n=1 Tax=Aromatoleum evansii TaxID=59406 RepID=A0ABZ1AJ37_AROEV|nr:lysylphosphatidylglycerol synthase domain-containing protein [Aromatoleum evansii]
MKRLLAIAASLALLAWLAWDGRWQGLGDAFRRLDPLAATLALAGFAASYALRAGRVYDEFRSDARGRFGTCLRIVLIHNAMVNVVPFRGGEAAFPVLLGRNFGTPLARALASLFWFRLQDAFVVAVVAVAVWPGLPLPLRLTGITALVAFAWYLPRWARAPHAWAERGGAAAKLAKLRNAFADSTRHARFGWIWTLANWSVKLATQAWLLASLVPAALSVGAAGALGAELAAILPVQGVAGFGTYEAGAAAAMLPNGVPFASGLQAALALHLFVIACAVASGALAWLVPARAASARDPDRPHLS